MQTYQVGLISLVMFGLMGLFAFIAWRRRMRAQEQLLPAPVSITGDTNGAKGFYVATTFAGRPLDRVLAHGLAHRGIAFVNSTAQGVAISRTGEKSFFIPTADLIGTSTTSAVIDRAVEKDGLISIRWRLGQQEVETHFRFVGAAERSGVLEKLSLVVEG